MPARLFFEVRADGRTMAVYFSLCITYIIMFVRTCVPVCVCLDALIERVNLHVSVRMH